MQAVPRAKMNSGAEDIMTKKQPYRISYLFSLAAIATLLGGAYAAEDRFNQKKEVAANADKVVKVNLRVDKLEKNASQGMNGTLKLIYRFRLEDALLKKVVIAEGSPEAKLLNSEIEILKQRLEALRDK